MLCYRSQHWGRGTKRSLPWSPAASLGFCLLGFFWSEIPVRTGTDTFSTCSQGWGHAAIMQSHVGSGPRFPSVSTALAGQGAGLAQLLLWPHRDAPFGAAAEPCTMAVCPSHWFCILLCFPCGCTHWQLSRAWLGRAQSLPSAAHLSWTPHSLSCCIPAAN